MYELKNKVILITGAANGIGAETVKIFLEEGAKHVAILDVDNDSGTALQNALNKVHGDHKVKFFKCDITIDEELFGAFETFTKENGYIDLVVNNAGVANESDSSSIRKEIEVNYLALVNSTLKALELMRKDSGGSGGTVINVSSIASLCQASPSLFVYMGTKSAVLQFSNCIGAKEYYTKTGVRVLTVCFGVTNTQIFHEMRSFDEEINNQIQEIINLYPMQAKASAAKGLVEAYKKGESGSTWLVANDKPAVDYTAYVQNAYKSMTDHLID